MLQGTMSGVGKSILTAGILRVFHQDGYRVAPFKSQNMALNSFVTSDGREIGRAQALQAAAAGLCPSSDMNPVLIKPMGETASQIIVNGLPLGNMKAFDYFNRKREFLPDILNAYDRLSKDRDIIVIEGAGSPAEINLRQNDIVNMGLAEALDAPVLLVGNIDPGGVFAQLLGTVELMPPQERARVKGLIINKFRGDVSLLAPGLSMFKAYCSIPFAGIVPYLPLMLDEEDSMSDRLGSFKGKEADGTLIKISVIRFPYISNYTDFGIFEGIKGLRLSYTDSVRGLSDCDLVILPGTKNTIADLKWMNDRGISAKLIELSQSNIPVIGICGGFQMLGRSITDEAGTEGGGSMAGLSLLPVETSFSSDKTLSRKSGTINALKGMFSPLSGTEVSGYEIHMGKSVSDREIFPVISEANVLGTYLHGIFDSTAFTSALIRIIYNNRGIDTEISDIISPHDRQEGELDRLADLLRQSLDWEMIYRITGV